MVSLLEEKFFFDDQLSWATEISRIFKSSVHIHVAHLRNFAEHLKLCKKYSRNYEV